MAEKKEHKLVAASENSKPAGSAPNMKPAKPVGNSAGLRVGAVICWVVALAMEVLAILVLFGKINLTFMPQLWQLILFLVIDLVFVIIGAQLWKKANHIKPASEKNKALFWIWNNMGVIVAAFCFIPFIILALTNKNVDKKTKIVAVVVAVIALLIGGLLSYDYNPVSAEQLEAATSVLGDETVYWARFGKVYHTHEDCQALNVSEELTYGSVEEAIAANRTRLCSFCARRDAITGVATDEQE